MDENVENKEKITNMLEMMDDYEDNDDDEEETNQYITKEDDEVIRFIAHGIANQVCQLKDEEDETGETEEDIES